jgi:hypothetical protein
MLKALIGIALLYVSFKLAYYLRSIAPRVNRPVLFRNPLTFSALNFAMAILPILGLWFLLAGVFSFRAPFGIGE